MLDFRVHNLPPQLRVHSSQTIRSTIAEAKVSYKCAGDRGIGQGSSYPASGTIVAEEKKSLSRGYKSGAGGSQIARRQMQYALIGGTAITHNLCARGTPLAR